MLSLVQKAMTLELSLYTGWVSNYKEISTSFKKAENPWNHYISDEYDTITVTL